jgi:serine kinase of HPr protein (carbohydrate metabolism regulator)
MTTFPASAVSIKGRAVLLEGPSGAGKSDLALRLMEKGAALISDDYVDLEVKQDTLFASPPKTIEGKIEARGIGIVEKSFEAHVPVSILITLVDRDTVPRMPNNRTREINGITIPAFRLHAFDASTPVKVFLLLEKN